MIRIRASMLSTGEMCERKFACDWLLSSGLGKEYGIETVPHKTHVGAIVGSAAHDGVSFLLQQFHEKGDWGNKATAKIASTYAGEYVARESRDNGMSFDQATKNASSAVKSAVNIVKEYHAKIKPSGHTEIIETQLGCRFVDQVSGTEYEMTGTVDRFILVDGALRDLKTSPRLRSHHAQIGAYIDILEANGHRVDEAMLDHIPRTATGRPQEPLKVVNVDKDLAKLHSRSVHAKMHGNIERLIETGDTSATVANPSCDLCSAKFCRAYGTGFCPMGKAVNG